MQRIRHGLCDCSCKFAGHGTSRRLSDGLYRQNKCIKILVLRVMTANWSRTTNVLNQHFICTSSVTRPRAAKRAQPVQIQPKDKKIWNASRICVSSLRRGHANLLCIVPILVYVVPKQLQPLVLNCDIYYLCKFSAKQLWVYYALCVTFT